MAGYRAAKRDMRKAELSSSEIYNEAERLVREYGDMLNRELDSIKQKADFKKEKAISEFENNVRGVLRDGLAQAGSDFNQKEFEDYVVLDLAYDYCPDGWILDL